MVDSNNNNNELDTILDEWSSDAKIVQTKISEETANIASLQAKYLRYYSKHQLLAKKASGEYNKIRKWKWRYYNGKVSVDELKKMGIDQFQYTILKTDVGIYLDADKELTEMSHILHYHENIVKVCEYILKELNQRSYQMRLIFDNEKFYSGN